MKKINGLVLLSGGVTMTIAAFNATTSMGTDFALIFAGFMPNHVIWLLGGGVTLMVCGLTRRLSEAR
jgi:hypothetical protein